MNKLLSFTAGLMCGALVGAAAALLLTPASGQELRSEATNRWEMALGEARQAMEETRAQLERQFEEMKKGKAPG